MIALDCVMIVDGDLSPAAERQLARLLKVHRDASISTGLLTLRRPGPRVGLFGSKTIMALVDGDAIRWIDRDAGAKAPLCLVLSPGLAAIRQTTPVRLRTEQVVVWPIEPRIELLMGAAVSGEALSLADQAPGMARLIAERLKAPVVWAARTAGERHDLRQHAIGLTLADWIWWPVLEEPQATAHASCGVKKFVGRHWHADKPLDPIGYGTFAAAFTDCWQMDLAFYGRRAVLESLPSVDQSQGMRLFDEEDTPLSAFLSELSLFVAVGDHQAETHMPYAMFEAMQEDVVVIAPPAMSVIIDSPLPATAPGELMGLAARLLSDDLAYARAQRHQQQLITERHGAGAHRTRLERYLKQPGSSPRTSPNMSSPFGRVLFISDDSPHLEHLTRGLAVAERLPATLKPHFLTTARNARLVKERGYPIEYVQAHNSPGYQHLFDEANAWNYWFERHVAELITFTKARALVFDGVYPFGGLMANQKRFPGVAFIWVRQPLWRPGAKRDALKHSQDFDLIVEPGDLASSFDRGPLEPLRRQVLETPPIRLDAPISRAEARQRLGLSDDSPPAILIDPTLPADRIGGETLFTLLDELMLAGATLWRIDPTQASFAEAWPMDVKTLDDPWAGRYRSAFDAAIAAADYRSLHENVAAHLPSVLVMGLGSSTDDQAARAAFAEGEGIAMLLRTGDVYGAKASARDLLDPDCRERMAAMLGDFVTDNGADMAARAIADLVLSVDLPGLDSRI